MISFLLAQKLDSELDLLRRKWKIQGRNVNYARFPRLYRFLHWEISDPEHDEKRGTRLVVTSYFIFILINLIMAVYVITDWRIPWATSWAWPLGATFSLVITILYWEPYRQEAVKDFDFALPMQMIWYLAMGTFGIASLTTHPSPAGWALALAFPLAVAFFCCYRLGRLYERDLLRGRH